MESINKMEGIRAMQRNPESLLLETVREWVLQRLPIDRSDSDLMAHLKSKDAHGLLIVYHNWQSRLISIEPRTVHRSTAFTSNELADQHKMALAAIIADIEVGLPLTKYLSRDVKIAAALPGNSPALQRRRDLDLMLNDWGIHHLHLSTMLEDDGFVSRTGPLLFAVFKHANAYLLDVMEHGSWSSKHLLEVLVREFPQSGAFHILNGVVGLSYEPDEHDRRALRNRAVNSPIMIDGKAVMPTMGMALSGTTVAATRDSDMLLDAIEGFERVWATEPSRIRDAVVAGHGMLPELPDFVFEMHETAGAGIFEKKSKTFISLL